MPVAIDAKEIEIMAKARETDSLATCLVPISILGLFLAIEKIFRVANAKVVVLIPPPVDAVINTYPVLQNVKSTSCTIPEITGDNTICPGTSKQFALQNAPNGAVVNWSVSFNLTSQFNNPNFINVETEATSGIGTITATVNGYEVVKEVKIGNPIVPNNGIAGGYDNVGINTSSQFQVAFIKGVQYYWEVVRSAPAPNCSSQPTFEPYGTTPVTVSNRYATIDWGNCPGNYRIACLAVNECGQTYIGEKWVTVYDPYDDNENPCDDGPIEVYPNPSNGNSINVNRLPPTVPCDQVLLKSNSAFSNTSAAQANTIINEVHIYTLTGLMVYNQTFTGEYDFTINNLGLSEGYYILELVTENNQVLTTQLMVDQ